MASTVAVSCLASPEAWEAAGPFESSAGSNSSFGIASALGTTVAATWVPCLVALSVASGTKGFVPASAASTVLASSGSLSPE